MNRYAVILIFLLFVAFACKQKDNEAPAKGNSLLWRVSGNGLEKPSYLYGTVHIICSEDAALSENFKKIIRKADAVYFEVDMDDMTEMMSSIDHMKMRGDTTLELLLSESDFEKVKQYVEDNSSMLPFSELKKFLPILVSTILAEQVMDCEESTGIEELIMKQAKKIKKPIHGMESSAYQFSLMDSIPYAEQAKELVVFVDSAEKEGSLKAEMDKFYDAYLEQNMDKVEKITMEMDCTLIKYADMLLYNRNRNWVVKLKKLMPEKSVVVAVGAGHLPGKNGLIDLLKKEGYEVTALENNFSKGKK